MIHFLFFVVCYFCITTPTVSSSWIIITTSNVCNTIHYYNKHNNKDHCCCMIADRRPKFLLIFGVFDHYVSQHRTKKDRLFTTMTPLLSTKYINYEIDDEDDGYNNTNSIDVTSSVSSSISISTTTTTAFMSSNMSPSNNEQQHQQQHTRRKQSIPYEQRITQQRLARRMNHPFKYLYRHGFDNLIHHHQPMKQQQHGDNSNHTSVMSVASSLDDPETFLRVIGQYTYDQIVQMNSTFPMLLQLSVREQLFPKFQFLLYTILQQQQQQQQQKLDTNKNNYQCINFTNTVPSNDYYYRRIPPYYYGTRLERIIAPRHAFLVWFNLPFGLQLFHPIMSLSPLQSNELEASSLSLVNFHHHHHQQQQQQQQEHNQQQSMFQEFLRACRNTKQFAAMCQRWSTMTTTTDYINTTTAIGNERQQFTAKHIEAFEMIFSRGLLAVCRNDLVQHNNTWALDQLPTMKAADMVPLLISHGANIYERDHRGATVLHWACGTGHWDIVEQLLPYFPNTTCCTITTIRDGATPFHWAAAGCNTREFGTGGHVHICEQLLAHVRSSTSISTSTSILNIINQCTYDGNSALMWAAWSGTIETVKLLVRNKAKTTIVNRNGCSVAHWAASGGNVDVCKYLHDIANVDFTVPNYGGNTPLSHAVAFQRTDVVEWLLQVNHEANILHNKDSILAYTLAQDFVGWSIDVEQKEKRSKIVQLFDDESYDWIGPSVS